MGVDGQLGEDVMTTRGLGAIQGSTGSQGDVRLSQRNRAMSQGRAGSAQGVERPSGAIWGMDWRENLGLYVPWVLIDCAKNTTRDTAVTQTANHLPSDCLH